MSESLFIPLQEEMSPLSEKSFTPAPLI